jgi:hypothetical protein
MNTNRRLALALAALIPTAVLRARVAGAAPAEASLPADSPLHRFVGSWRGDVTVQRAGGEVTRYVQENRFTWILGGRFLEERGTDTNGDSFVGIWGSDGNANKYRAHYFLAPSGDVVTLSQAWDESKRTFTGSADLPGGLRMLKDDHFLSADAYQWTITVQDSKRATLVRTQGKERRIRP